MSEQAAAQGGKQSTADERERAAEAESYGGRPIDSQELADVWTAGGAVDPNEGSDRAGRDTAGDDTAGSDPSGGDSTGGDTSGGDRASGDVVSDPAQGDQVGSDWSDEGGATPAGPATDEPTD